MRLIVDSLIALMLVAILAAILLHYRQEQHELRDYQFVHTSLARLHDQVIYHRALGDVELRKSGFPAVIRPDWFGSELPLNVLVPMQQPWVDIAPAGDMDDQPPDPVITQPDQAGFWYNPNRGVFRARVVPQVSEQETLRVYNRLNGTSLLNLPYDAQTSRRPEAMPLLTETEVMEQTPPAQSQSHYSAIPDTSDTLQGDRAVAVTTRPTLGDLPEAP